MQRIPIKFAAPGLSLARPIAREDGMVLAGEGTVLTDSIIERLKSADVGSIVVKGKPFPWLTSGLDLQKLLERIPFLFRKYQDDQLMVTMRNMISQYFERAIQAEQAAGKSASNETIESESGKDGAE